MKKVAVVLCGSGFKDGSEIRESVATLWALSQQPVEVHCFAPDLPQTDVINCLTGKPLPGESRNMLIEAARIARGQVRPLVQLNAGSFDALIIPGGYGVAKNLCTFAEEGSKASVLPELQQVIEKMHVARKPLGAVCIAPVVLALALRGKALELTLGDPCEASEEIEKLGHKHHVCAAHECHVDRHNKVVTTPAYMVDDAALHHIFSGIQRMVEEVVRLTGSLP